MSASVSITFAVCFVTVVVVVGVYMIRRLESGVVAAKRAHEDALRANRVLTDDNRALKAELELAKRIRGASDE